MKKENLYTEAEASRNTLMLEFYGMEERITKAATAADYIDLIRRTGMLAESMAKVLAKMSESGETLKPVDGKTLNWIKKM